MSIYPKTIYFRTEKERDEFVQPQPKAEVVEKVVKKKK